MKPIIEVKHVSKKFNIGFKPGGYLALRDVLAEFAKSVFLQVKINKRENKQHKRLGEFWALKNLTFEVMPGEVVGIIGPNGAGKSTFLKILTRITPPTKGEIILRGKVASLLEVGTGFHPELTGRENVFLNGAILGMTMNDIKERFNEIVEFSGVEKFLDIPVKHYSSGMYTRLAFAVAAHLDPDILIVDEILSVGDAEFQKKSLGKMHDVSSQGRTVIFVSHNLSAITSLCTRVILLNSGKIVEIGKPEKVVAAYLKKAVGAAPKVNLPPGSSFANGIVRLLAIKVHDEKGKVLQAFDITKPIGIDIEYKVLKPDIWFSCHLLLRDSSGSTIFHSPEDANKLITCRKRGIYKSTCWIPGNFLAEGSFNVRILVDGSFEKTKIIDFQNAISFYIHDNLDGNSVRGKLTEQLKGIVRPKLIWERKYIDKIFK